jgi:hypothetical protein
VTYLPHLAKVEFPAAVLPRHHGLTQPLTRPVHRVVVEEEE